MTNEDKDFLNSDSQTRKLRLIDGTTKYVKRQSIVGYCHCKLHKGYISRKLLKSHDCINKKCSCLEKFKEYPFWVEYEKNSEMELLARDRKKQLRKKKQKQGQLISQMLMTANSFSQKVDAGIVITHIMQIDKSNKYIIFYVSNAKYDDSEQYRFIAKHMQREYHYSFRMKHVMDQNRRYVTFENLN